LVPNNSFKPTAGVGQLIKQPSRAGGGLILVLEDNMTTKVALLLVLALFVGDAAAIEFSGKSTATPVLKQDILKALLPLASAITQCKAIDSIQMSLETMPDDVKTNSNGIIISGSPVIERWVAAGCGTSVALKVTLAPDGKGGEFYTISTRQ
jgi:hypothetical protein